jgi:hypothetical protein
MVHGIDIAPDLGPNSRNAASAAEPRINDNSREG